jgi:hypothetical protein
MSLYTDPTPGGLPTAIYPGTQFTLFNGSETPGAGLKSAAFNRAPGPLQGPSAQVFTVTFPSSATATILIQASNDDVDAHYQTISTIAFAGVTTPGYYADLGEFRYYRANLSAYSGGGMPTVLVQR